MTGKRPTDTQRTQLGYAYVLLCERTGLYKLGSARNPVTRLRAIAREMQSRCVLVHTVATNHRERLERTLQARFPACHVGGEWYELNAEQVRALCVVSAVFYRVGWQPRSTLRADFDAGGRWAASLPVCGAA